MKPIVMVGTIIVHLALISYGAGIVIEQVKHRVTRSVLLFLGLGLLFDSAATICMIIGSGRGLITERFAGLFLPSDHGCRFSYCLHSLL